MVRFYGLCMEGTCGVFHLCAERAALQHVSTIRTNQGQAHYCFSRQASLWRRFWDALWACREFLLELDAENRHLEFMVDYESHKTITLGELMPFGGRRTGLSERE